MRFLLNLKEAMTDKDRATLPELLEFANKIREAGGGNPLDALMPAVPQDSTQCLIARNLNFNCMVNQIEACMKLEQSGWYMGVDDSDVRDRIASALNLEPFEFMYDDDKYYGVILPDKIGAVAEVFDDISDRLDQISSRIKDEDETWQEDYSSYLPSVQEFWPYIENSVKEAYDLADTINDDGSIVI